MKNYSICTLIGVIGAAFAGRYADIRRNDVSGSND